MTSNPSIFEKAIGATDHYDTDIQAGLGRGTLAVGSIYEALAVADIRRAADVLRPVYQAPRAPTGSSVSKPSPISRWIPRRPLRRLVAYGAQLIDPT